MTGNYDKVLFEWPSHKWEYHVVTSKIPSEEMFGITRIQKWVWDITFEQKFVDTANQIFFNKKSRDYSI